MEHAKLAADLFTQGYNCAQAVFVAFQDLTGLEKKTAARMVSGFGGGVGQLREVCGAVSGMVAVLSFLYGYDEPGDNKNRMRVYKDIQALTGQFRETNGSIICREILKLQSAGAAPAFEMPEGYGGRSCTRMVYTAAMLLDAYIAEHPLP